MAKDKDIVKLAHKQFEESMDVCNENRMRSVDDVEFAYAEDGQWEESLRIKRKGQPCYTYNKVAGAIDQVVGDQRRQRPRIKVVGVEQSDKELADIYTGLIKNIENQSDAPSAYDWAFMYAVAGGYGVFRIHYDYSDPTSFDQEIQILKLKNPFSAYYDPAAIEYSKSDGRYWFIIEDMPRDQFEHDYPDATPASWETVDRALSASGWLTEDSVRVAEYWCKKPVKRELVELSDGRTMFADEMEDVADELSAQGVTVKRTRVVNDEKIVWYKIAGDQIVEGPKDWAGRYFPIVPVFGKEVNIAGKDYYRGIVRFAKDAQRGYNLQRSVAIEEVALRPKAPYLVTPKMIAGYEKQWAAANTKSAPYLPYNSDQESPTGKPYREQTPEVPVAALQLASIDSDDIKATTGIYDASLGARSNETSGRAIRARQLEGDTATYEYIDNLGRSMKYAGKVLVDLIPVIYDTQRQVRLLNDDGTTKGVTINETVLDVETGELVKVRDLSRGKFDVVIDIGPNYSTQRIEAADSMMAFMQSNPQAGAMIADLVAKNQDWPGSDQIAKRLKMLLPPQIRQMEEGEEGQQIPPAAQAQIMQMQQALQQMQQVVEQGLQQYQAMQQELEQTKLENQNLKTGNEIKAGELAIKAQEQRLKEAQLILDKQRLQLEAQQQQIDALLAASKADSDQQKAQADTVNAHASMVEAQVAAAQANAPLAEMMQNAAALMAQAAERMGRPKKARAMMPDGRVIVMQSEDEEIED